jgi:hypothetical protein
VGDLAMLYGNFLEFEEICSATAWSQMTHSGYWTGRRSRMKRGGWLRCSLISSNTWSMYFSVGGGLSHTV